MTSRELLNALTLRKAHLETLPQVPELGMGVQLAQFSLFPCVMVFYDFQEVQHKKQALHFTSSNQIWLPPPFLAKSIHHPAHLNVFQWVLQPSPVKLLLHPRLALQKCKFTSSHPHPALPWQQYLGRILSQLKPTSKPHIGHL